MIGSHNSFSFANSLHNYEKIKADKLKCQNCDIKTQYDKYNIRFFDIHICNSTNNSYIMIQNVKISNKLYKYSVCNTGIELTINFYDIKHLIKYMRENAPNALYRIIFDDKDTSLFLAEISNITSDYLKQTNCIMIAILNKWNVLYYNDNKYPNETYDYTLKEISFNTSIEKWSKMNNPIFTKKEINDKNNLYIIDFCNNCGE